MNDYQKRFVSDAIKLSRKYSKLIRIEEFRDMMIRVITITSCHYANKFGEFDGIKEHLKNIVDESFEIFFENMKNENNKS